jgi:hypothetical protein
MVFSFEQGMGAAPLEQARVELSQQAEEPLEQISVDLVF